MELIEHTTEERLTREQAAAKLRQLADTLARHNEVSFVRNGMQYTVKVPNEVTYSVEIEAGDDASEIEVEISW